MESNTNTEIIEKQENETQENNDENSEKVKCVFVSGLPYNTTEDEIREKFKDCGFIKYNII